MMPRDDDRRDGGRGSIELKVEYQRLNKFFHDYTKNISRGGTFVRTPRPLGIGTTFAFRLFIPTLTMPLKLTGEVRWVQQEGESAEPGMGIQFVFADEGEREVVERVAEKLMVGSLGQLIYARLRALGR